MLRTGPAALSLPGPFGAAGFHPTVATSTAGLLRPFRSRRPWRAVSCAFRTPAVRLPGCKAQRRFACRVPTLRRVPAHSLLGFFTLLSPFSGAYRATTCRTGCPGCNEQPTKLFAWGRKNFCVLPRTDASGRGVYALAANGSQTGEGNNQRARSAGPRKTSKPRPRQLNG